MAYRAEISDFGNFYERTYQVAFRTALAIVRDAALAADVTQDAYAAAYQHRDRFRGEAPGAAWLHKIVVNHALSAVRRRRPVIAEVDVADASFVQAGQRPDHARASSDRVTLFAALDRLTPKQRAAVVLRYYVDYDYATIAEVLGTTTTNVGAMLSRALDRLRAELENPQAPELAEATR
jgi:RNA polymerase sigma factor (sigma-70 family)